MTAPTFAALSPALSSALSSRGFTALTPVQEAVLDPALAGRDLRISSQTGSGKTVAVGLVLAPDLEAAAAERVPDSKKTAPSPAPGPAKPAALLVAPTRELAMQLGKELSWLYQPLGLRVAVVTGGSSYGNELRSLRQGPLVVVGTPGRLVDHLERGSVDGSAVQAVVLDEADQMLDFGFREELEAILGRLPEGRRTHLVSATFPREVLALANRYQKNAARVEGTAAGEANEDITHVAHLIHASERDEVIVNLLLMAPGERTLVFVRTREGAADLADVLGQKGFAARPLSGEMEQWERTKTLDAFRSGAVTTLVATDVAARGLDVPDVGRVIHADPPGDSEALTHRSGRTGRAGRKGTSVVLVPPAARDRLDRLYRRARVDATWLAAPTADDVRRSADERLIADLLAASAEPVAEGEGEARVEVKTDARQEARLRGLAGRLLAEIEPEKLVIALLSRTRHTGACEPAEVTPILPPAAAPAARRPHPMRADRGPSPSSFAPFRINWGERQGADARRLLALVCRRGNIQGNQVGAIRIADFYATFEVDARVAEGFARAAMRPDERDPRIVIRPLESRPMEDRPEGRPMAPRPFPRRPMEGRPMEARPAPRAEEPRAPGGFAPPKRQKSARWS